MRNDARPIGEGEVKSPVADDRSSVDVDRRPSVPHDRQSHIVNRKAEEDARRDNRENEENDPAMLDTKI